MRLRILILYITVLYVGNSQEFDIKHQLFIHGMEILSLKNVTPAQPDKLGRFLAKNKEHLLPYLFHGRHKLYRSTLACSTWHFNI